MTDGTAAGLTSAALLVAEADAKRRKKAAELSAMDAEQSGQFAATVYRKKGTGERTTREALEADIQEKKRKRAEEEAARKPEWAAGVAQRRAHEEAAAHAAEEAAAPFARYSDDAALNRMQREQVRWDDPFAHLAAKKHEEAKQRELLDRDASLRSLSRFSVPLETPSHSWLKRRIGAPPNRYGIQPGRHWDGVDRSNGTEQGLFKTQNEMRAREKVAFEYNTAQFE